MQYIEDLFATVIFLKKKKNSGGADYQWKKLPVDGSNAD